MSKRARTVHKKKFTKRRRKFNTKTRKPTFKKDVQRVIDKNLENKLAVYKPESAFTSIAGTVQLYRNHVDTLHVNIIYTSQGIQNPDTSKVANRVGDVIHSKGISFQFALELDVTQIECHFKTFIVKSARGDFPTDGYDSTLFVNVTSNNMMDCVNRKRFIITKLKPSP
jgi:hypothetical protein